MSPILSAVVRRYRLDRDEQLDAVQDGWLYLLENQERIREPASVPGWVSTTVRRRALRAARERHREILWEHHVIDQQPMSASSTERRWGRAERDHLLWRTIALLPPPEREVVELLVVDPGLTGRRLADRLGISRSSAARIRTRSLRRMRRLLVAEGILGP